MIHEMIDDPRTMAAAKVTKDKTDKTKNKNTDVDPDPDCCTPPDTDPGPIGG